jgi:hypothetical protein
MMGDSGSLSTPNESDEISITFRCDAALRTRDAVALTGALLAEIPIAPATLQIHPAGHGVLTYLADDKLTTAEVADALAWLRHFPGLEDVSWRVELDL